MPFKDRKTGTQVLLYHPFQEFCRSFPVAEKAVVHNQEHVAVLSPHFYVGDNALNVSVPVCSSEELSGGTKAAVKGASPRRLQEIEKLEPLGPFDRFFKSFNE
jgi:hypothetical protein